MAIMDVIRIFSRRNSILSSCYKSLSVLNSRVEASQPSIFQSMFFSSFYNPMKPFPSSKLTLTPFNPSLVSSCGIKVKGQLSLRCKDCYFARKDGVMYVFCNSYPRHKQRALRKAEKRYWILTSCSQTKFRPY